MLWFGEKIVVKGVGSAVLKDKIQFGLGLNDWGQFGDGGMVEFSKYVDFPLKIPNLVGIIDPLLLVYLYGYLLVGAFVHAHPHQAICSFAELAIDVVMHKFLLLQDGHI